MDLLRDTVINKDKIFDHNINRQYEWLVLVEIKYLFFFFGAPSDTKDSNATASSTFSFGASTTGNSGTSGFGSVSGGGFGAGGGGSSSGLFGSGTMHQHLVQTKQQIMPKQKKAQMLTMKKTRQILQV